MKLTKNLILVIALSACISCPNLNAFFGCTKVIQKSSSSLSINSKAGLFESIKSTLTLKNILKKTKSFLNSNKKILICSAILIGASFLLTKLCLNPYKKFVNKILLDAVKEGDLKKTKKSVLLLANVNTFYEKNKTALHIACKKGFKNIIESLISCGAKINARDWKNKTPLHIACKKGLKNIVEILVNNGAEINVFDKGFIMNKHYGNIRTPLHYASICNNSNIIEILLNKDSSGIDLLDGYGNSPLHEACSCMNIDKIKILIKKGAKINIKNDDCRTPLHKICDEGFCGPLTILSNIFEILIQNGAEVNTQDNNLETPLHTACENNSKNVLEILIQNGANVNAKNISKKTPLHIACKNNFKDILEILIKNGANVNAKNTYKETPLYVACENNFKDILEILIKNGANVNAKNISKKTPLHIACENNFNDIIKILARKGAKIDQAVLRLQKIPTYLKKFEKSDTQNKIKIIEQKLCAAASESENKEGRLLLERTFNMLINDIYSMSISELEAGKKLNPEAIEKTTYNSLFFKLYAADKEFKADIGEILDFKKENGEEVNSYIERYISTHRPDIFKNIKQRKARIKKEILAATEEQLKGSGQDCFITCE